MARGEALLRAQSATLALEEDVARMERRLELARGLNTGGRGEGAPIAVAFGAGSASRM